MNLQIARADDEDRESQSPGQTSTQRLHQLIRDDIVEGRLTSGSRLKVVDLAQRYGTSTNPVREALHQLQGEGIVVITANRGARVRSIDEDFVRNVFEIRVLIEAYLVRWFVEYATEDEIVRLEAIQERIEKEAFDDRELLDELNDQFHRITFNRHYNREAREIRERQRGIVKALSRKFPPNRVRRLTMVREHRAFIEAAKKHDVGEAVRVIEEHVRGAGRHLIEQMRAARS
jgi:DNA-binding GntR family transcriptional regulator